MYYVIGTHNSSLEIFPQVITRVVEDTEEAIGLAREIASQTNDYNIRKVFLLELEKGKVYKLSDYLPSSKRNPVVLTITQLPGKFEWVEEFVGDFKERIGEI